MLKNRKQLLRTLNTIFGKLQPFQNPENLLENQENRTITSLKEKEGYRASLKPEFKIIFANWFLRAKILIKIRSQVGGILELYTRPYCDFCGKNSGLRCESIGDLETVFYEFLEETPGQSADGWDFSLWQQYFLEHVDMRTLCYDCYNSIVPNTKDFSV